MGLLRNLWLIRTMAEYSVSKQDFNGGAFQSLRRSALFLCPSMLSTSNLLFSKFAGEGRCYLKGQEPRTLVKVVVLNAEFVGWTSRCDPYHRNYLLNFSSLKKCSISHNFWYNELNTLWFRFHLQIKFKTIYEYIAFDY